MVYARGLLDRFAPGASLSRRLGVLSAAAMTLLGAGLAANSLPAVAAAASIALSPLGATAGVLGLGLLFGLKHATEADHMAAIGAIVSEQGGLRRALWTGGLWGSGHTISIVVAGLFVLGLRLAIPESMARSLEFGVALMIIGLGSTALGRALRNRPDAHVHRHAHDSRDHAHPHFHEGGDQHLPSLDGDTPRRVHGVHSACTIGVKPLCVGMMHGLAGSAALTLLVLAQIPSVSLGLIYLLVFGLGSIGGMVLMSLAISLPFAATVSRPRVNRVIRIASGMLSLGFGLFYAYCQLI